MAVFLWILAGLSLFFLCVTISSAQSAVNRDPDDVEQRVASLLKQMTLDEKLDYVGGVDRFYTRSIPRLGIPRFKMADGPMGIRNYGPSTVMAAGIALAASWDEGLAERVGIEIGRDARARGVHFLLGPGVNIYRAPMNGRNFEYFGEDPHLAARIASAYIQGVQSQEVCATAKHFIGNNSEFDRRESDAVIDERALREIYLPVFEAAVLDAHVGAIMTSYNKTNGTYMSQNGRLNKDIVKTEWGFDGVIMSDWTSTFDGVEAANRGLDLEMPLAVAMNRDVLLQAIARGRVSPETIDDKVARILRTAVRFGWLDRDQTDLTVPRLNRHGSEVALEAARSSMILLKNETGLLPLQKESLNNIAVIGPNAHPAVAVGGGSARVEPFRAVSFLEGLSDALKDTAEVHYHPGISGLAEIADRTSFYTDSSKRIPGLRMEIFDNVKLAGNPVRTCTERRVGAGEETSAVPEPFSSVRWTGFFTPPEEGVYEIFVQIPGERIGYRLYLDGRQVMDAWKFSRYLMDSAQVTLADGPHEVILELVRRGGGFTGGSLRMGIVQTDRLVDPESVALAKNADAVLVAVGFNHEIESESGDRTFELPFGQDLLIRKIAEANANTIVVVNSGGAVDISQWLDAVPAVIMAWYPGQEGGIALSGILLGNVDPSGRLPITMERRWEDNPTFASYYPQTESDRVVYNEGIFVGYRGYERNGVEPLFPFGYGLSYTEFKYSGLEISPFSEEGGGSGGMKSGFRISFNVENTGSRTGSDVAQLYVTSSGNALPRPPKELKGFKKVTLEPGEKQNITIDLGRRAFCYYDDGKKSWQVEDGEREILIGRSSENIVLRGKAAITVMPDP